MRRRRMRRRKKNEEEERGGRRRRRKSMKEEEKDGKVMDRQIDDTLAKCVPFSRHPIHLTCARVHKKTLLKNKSWFEL